MPPTGDGCGESRKISVWDGRFHWCRSQVPLGRAPRDPTGLEAAIDIDDSTLRYHLNQLVDGGLIERRQKTDRGQGGPATDYRATIFGEVTLTAGVDELIRGEREFVDLYDSATER